MEKAVIWDLDGTLLDSYGLIVKSVEKVLEKYNINMSSDEILNYIISKSIDRLFQEISNEKKISVEKLKIEHSSISEKGKVNINLIENAKVILEYLDQNNVSQFVFTHRGETTLPVLKNLDIEKYFIEIITSQTGFQRKPSGEALEYLVQKYKLEKENTYYVGDRNLDVDSANNASIKSVLFIPNFSVAQSAGNEDFLINDLLDMRDVIKS